MQEQRYIINPELLSDITRLQAQHQPELVALADEKQSWTFAQIDGLANQFAQFYVSQGVGAGQRVVWLAQNIAWFWAAWIGAAKIGAVLVPLNWRLTSSEIMQIMLDAQASLFISEDEFSASLDLAQLPPLFSLNADTEHHSLANSVAAQSDQVVDYQANINDPVIQLYTSGTTGLPKGVVLTHRGFRALVDDHQKLGSITPSHDAEWLLHTLPHFHIAGAALGLIAWQQSMPVMQLRQFDIDAIAQLAKQGKPLNAFFVPAMILMLIESAQAKGFNLDNFASISYGAAPMPEALLDKALAFCPHTRLFQLYGMTETTGGLSVLSAEDHRKEGKHRLSAGKPMPSCEVRIVDPDTLENLETEQIGEIVARSAYVMDGYWNNPSATDKVIRDGWYWTGDAGYLDADGYLYVVDRLKDMIISGGENIYPAELENHLFKHPAVLECAVVGKPNDKWGEVCVVFVALRADHSLNLETMNHYLGDQIAKFKLPQELHIVDALPRNPSGKVLKTQLRASL